MNKTLFVYYTRTGKTGKIYSELAKRIQGDIEEIIDNKNRKGILGFITGAWDARRKSLTDIQPLKRNPKEYDLIVIGTPTWASTVVPAVRTYIEQNKNKFKKVAFVVTQSGGVGEKIYKDLSEVCKKKPIATMDISGKEFATNTWQTKINDFIKKI